MSLEMLSLILVVGVFFLSIVGQSLYTDFTEGLAFAMSSRDAPPANAGVSGRRLDRNVRNQVEGLIVFTPLVLAVELQQGSTALTQTAALVYPASRLAYPFCYMLASLTSGRGASRGHGPMGALPPGGPPPGSPV
jgi:uncharacterized MAPEG superfamily protein